MTNDIIYNITIYKGRNYSLHCKYVDDDDTPVDMSGWLVESTIREFAECNDGVDFYCVSDAEGVHIYLSAVQTEGLGFRSGEYDIFVTDPDNNLRVKLVRGRVNVMPMGTR